MADNPILIVGGGLGGLTTALALARRGRRARVLEGAAAFGAIGYGIQFGPNVFHVFDRLGLTEQVMAVADSPPAVLMLDAMNGKELVRIPTGGAAFRARFKYPYIIVHRIDVHNVLLEACRRSDAVELVANAMVTGFEDRGDSVAVTTADGRAFSGAALVAAGGVRSLFRAKLIGDGGPAPALRARPLWGGRAAACWPGEIGGGGGSRRRSAMWRCAPSCRWQSSRPT